jgi:peptide chain release factor 2
MYEEQAATVAQFQERLTDLRACLNVETTNQRIEELETHMSQPSFWDDPDTAQKVVQELKQLKGVVTAPAELSQELEDLEVLIEMAREEEDASQQGDIDNRCENIEQRLQKIELESLFNDPRDNMTVILSIHPGAGGTESCDWADMLYRMITRYCEKQGFGMEVLEYQPGDEAGLKSASLRVTGHNAYGMLKSEDGVHRLVRISPFDSASRRHTSFCAVEVLTEIDDDIDIEIREEDLKMDVYRASGAGGQHVNKTSSAVRLTHQPTGIVVACQVERSQHRNRDLAMKMLRAKLYDIELKKKEDEMNAQREGQKDVAWGSQIRSYVLHPYQMIKDLRTGHETGNVTKVLDGDLEGFASAYLKWNLERKSQASAN